MIATTVKINGDTGLAPLRRRIGNQHALQQVAGRSGRNTYVKHLRERNKTHGNKRGWKRTNFWAKAASSVSFAALGDGSVEISTSAIGVSLRYYGTSGLPGGVLRPLTGTYLTQPACAEAYGKRAREFSDLEFGFALDPETGRMRPALVRPATSLMALRSKARAGRGRAVQLPFGPGTKESSGEPVFWLNRSARMVGDATVLPPDGEIADGVMEAIAEYVDLLNERGDA